MPVKNRLKEIRHQLYIDTQVEMAELLDVRPEQYNRYERQITQPSLEIALQIAKKLKKTVEDIFYESGK
jgi:Predicted transcriptional regulators